jgi:hypothetical protein
MRRLAFDKRGRACCPLCGMSSVHIENSRVSATDEHDPIWYSVSLAMHCRGCDFVWEVFICSSDDDGMIDTTVQLLAR